MQNNNEILSDLSYLKIKKSWSEITVSDFFEIRAIQTNEKIHEFDKRIKLLAFLSGKEDHYFDSFPLREVTDLYNTLTFIDQKPSALLKEYYQIGKVKYQLIPRIENLTYGQLMDLNLYNKNIDLDLDNIHRTLSVVLMPVKPLTTADIIYNAIYRCTPKKLREGLNMTFREGITEKYMESPIEKTMNNIYDNLSIESAMSIGLFFCLVEKSYSICTLYYLEQECKEKLRLALMKLKENPEKMKEVLQIEQILDSFPNGDGLFL
jgi:hypothetical protein